jgi:hypothetical protein
MSRSSMRRGRCHQPALEGLEERKLLSTTTPSRVADVQSGISLSDRRMSYITPQGTHVLITLYGVGSLAGSTVSDGALNLVFSETNENTGIVARVSGGTGEAPLQSIRNANLPINNISGIGGSVLNIVNLKNFDLVSGGQINLTSGVGTLILNSVGQNTQINLRELAESFTTSGSTATYTNSGVTLTFTSDSLGARILSSVSGTFTPSPTLPSTKPTNTGSGVPPGPYPAPPGTVISINHIQGPARSEEGLGDPQVFGYDPVANALIRFDVITGQPTMTIPLTGMPTQTFGGVGLGRDNGQLVALVGNNSTIQAFNAVTGALVGQFSTANLAASGFKTITGIGSTGDKTVLADAPDGLLQAIDLTASLDSPSGQAVTVGAPYAPQRQFELAGDLSGVAASDTIYATGAAHFDTFQPDLFQAGILAVNAQGRQLSELTRTALKSKGSFINVGPTGAAASNPYQALGSVDQNLAVVSSVANGTNVVTLLNPSTLATTGTVTLDDPNRLNGLSESFRPDLQGTALIDVQGNVQSLRAIDAQGLVFNTAGYINLAKIKDATDTTIVALPFGHAQMPNRTNTIIESSSRTVDGRNGVTVVPNLEQAGPLSLP